MPAECDELPFEQSAEVGARRAVLSGITLLPLRARKLQHHIPHQTVFTLETTRTHGVKRAPCRKKWRWLPAIARHILRWAPSRNTPYRCERSLHACPAW
jgi:hypothetical protein